MNAAMCMHMDVHMDVHMGMDMWTYDLCHHGQHGDMDMCSAAVTTSVRLSQRILARCRSGLAHAGFVRQLASRASASRIAPKAKPHDLEVWDLFMCRRVAQSRIVIK